jgi:hypothetical protein
VPANPPQGPQVTQGPIDRVPCPWCGRALDFRAHADSDGGSAGWGSTLETGASADCDHCGRTSKIVASEKIHVIRLAPVR